MHYISYVPQLRRKRENATNERRPNMEAAPVQGDVGRRVEV